jgi:hypothetical protein
MTTFYHMALAMALARRVVRLSPMAEARAASAILSCPTAKVPKSRQGISGHAASGKGQAARERRAMTKRTYRLGDVPESADLKR